MVTEAKTRKIDGDTHFFYTPNYKDLRDLLPGSKVRELGDMMWRDPEARLLEMDRLGFDMQVLITQHALPSPLRPADKPLWLRTALAQLYNNCAVDLQNRYRDRFIPMATIPWDDIPASIKELERVKGLGLRAVQIAGSYMDKNLDVYDLYPFGRPSRVST